MKDVLQKASFLIVAISFVISAPVYAQGGPIPIIRNVGIIPVIWQGTRNRISAEARATSLIQSGFSSIARSSHRFQFINDTIVSHSWETAEGRLGLVEEFELQAFLSLTITEQGDLFILTTRLLGPQLDNYLVESDRVPRNWFVSSSDADITMRVKSLVFRLLNRYPVDVFVTSVQGSYITLSSGKKQNIYEGDKLDFYDITIQQIHPANGSWISFIYKPLGRAHVIDSKTHSAIAKLVSLEFEGAIGVGAAAKVNKIDSRRLFRNIARNESPEVELGKRFVEIKPFKENDHDTPQKEPPLPKTEPLPKVEKQQPKPPRPTMEEKEPKPVPQPIPNEEASPEEDDQPGFFENSSQFLAQYFKSIYGTTGYRGWSITGSAPATSKFPFWLLNHFEGWGEIPFDQQQFMRLGTNIGIGSTNKGNYFNLGVNASYTIRSPQHSVLMPFLDAIEFGAFTELNTSQVVSESFGGYDGIFLGGIFRFLGRYHHIDNAQTIEIEGSLKLRILGFGQAGLSGNTRTISGVFGYTLESYALLKRIEGVLEWGGLLRYENNSFFLDADSMKESSYYVGILVRNRF